MSKFITITAETGENCECFSIRGRCQTAYFVKCVDAYLAQFPDWIISKRDTVKDFGGDKCILFWTKVGFYRSFVNDYQKNIFRIPPSESIEN